MRGGDGAGVSLGEQPSSLWIPSALCRQPARGFQRVRWLPIASMMLRHLKSDSVSYRGPAHTPPPSPWCAYRYYSFELSFPRTWSKRAAEADTRPGDTSATHISVRQVPLLIPQGAARVRVSCDNMSPSSMWKLSLRSAASITLLLLALHATGVQGRTYTVSRGSKIQVGTRRRFPERTQILVRRVEPLPENRSCMHCTCLRFRCSTGGAKRSLIEGKRLHVKHTNMKKRNDGN